MSCAKFCKTRPPICTPSPASARPVTVLFSDLRDFTQLTANRPPAELIAQLNEYFSVMTEAVLAENGTVDKFVGDGMMAVWGNLRTDGPQADAQAALRCTLAMREGLARLNAKWLAQGWPVLRFGVGLNHGEATIGHVGSERKMDFTAIGEVVNTASRIEQLTSQLAHDILIGEAVAALAGDTFEIEPGGAVPVKGIAQPLPVFLLQGIRADADRSAAANLRHARQRWRFPGCFSPARPAERRRLITPVRKTGKTGYVVSPAK